MEEDRAVFQTKWVKIIGAVLILIVILRFGRIILLDIEMIEPERIHEQYVQIVKQIQGDIFEPDHLLLRYEHEINPNPYYGEYEMNSEGKLRVRQYDTVSLLLYLNNAFDDMTEEEQIEYMINKRSQFRKRINEIRDTIGYPSQTVPTEFRYRPNISSGTEIKMQAVTDNYEYHLGYEREIWKKRRET